MRTITLPALFVAALLALACDNSDSSAPPAGTPAAPSAQPAPAAPTTGPMTSPMTGAMIPSAAPAGSPAGSGESSAASEISWSLPEGWEQIEGSGMRFATLKGPTPGGQPLEISVTVFGGAAGGMLPNINRWRGQVSLPPITDADLPTASEALDLSGRPATLVNLTSPDNAMAIYGLIIPDADRTWFLKLTTESPSAEAQATFREIAQTVRLGQ